MKNDPIQSTPPRTTTSPQQGASKPWNLEEDSKTHARSDDEPGTSKASNSDSERKSGCMSDSGSKQTNMSSGLGSPARPGLPGNAPTDERDTSRRNDSQSDEDTDEDKSDENSARSPHTNTAKGAGADRRPL